MEPRALWTVLPLFALFVSPWCLTGCAAPAVVAGAEPVHMHHYCLASDDGEQVTCEPHERLAHLTSWFKEAVHRPGSTFSIWAVGPNRSASRRFFGACIPDRWGAPVWKKKGDFIAKARAGAGGSKTGLTEPKGCQPPGLRPPGRTQLVVSPQVSPLPPDVWQQIATGSAPQFLQSAIVCDRSPSTNGAACTSGALLELFDRWVSEGLLLPGATLSVEPVRDALQPFYHLSIPDLPLGERVAFVLSGRRELSRLFDGRSEQYTSTIAEAISGAVRRLRERGGFYRLFILSDLQQITPRTWDFSKTIPAKREFLGWLNKQSLAEDLRGIPVLVCGLQSGHFGHNSAANAARLRDLWQAALQMMGAAEVKFFSSCDAALPQTTRGGINHE
jgi:hypothetical protein